MLTFWLRRHPNSSVVSDVRIAIALLIPIYYISARFGLTYGSVESSASLIWAPAGISLAALLWFGNGIWPGILIGATLTSLSSRLPPLASVITVIANSGEPLLAAWFLRLVDFRPQINRVRDALALIFFGGIAAPLAGALLGAFALSRAGIGGNFLLVWETWWVGDFFGVILLTPLILVLTHERSKSLSGPRFLEALVLIAFFLGYGLLVFGREGPVQSFRELPIAFGIFPFAIWAAIRFEQTGNVILMFTVASVSLAATLLGHHELARSPLETLFTLQVYISLAAGTGLILAAAIMESKRAMEAALEGESQLKVAYDSLEERVRERTRELERGKKILADAQELAHVGSWVWDFSKDKIACSDELRRILGLEQGTLAFSEFIARIHPEDRDLAASSFRLTAETGTCYDFTHRIVRPDGSIRVLHGRGSAQSDSKGELVKMFGTAQDVTAQKEAECRLRRYVDEIKDLYNHAPCGYHSLDLQGRYLEVNDTEAALLGYSREELIGKTFFMELLEEEGMRSFLNAFCRLREGGTLQQLEVKVRRKDGHLIPVLMNATALRDDRGQIISCRFSLMDLTERKRAEESRDLTFRAEFARKEAEASAFRASFLAEATQALASSLDPDEVLNRIARLAVPQICDWCIIDVVTEDQQMERVITHCDPIVEKRALELNRKYPPRLEDEGGSAGVIRDGRPVLVAEINEAGLKKFHRAPEYASFVRSLRPVSYMAVPITLRDKTIGAINFMSTSLGRHFTHSDLDLAAELGRRAALALENARLYRLAREAVATRDDFLSIASHELKTPITSLKLRLQMGLRSLHQNRPVTTETLGKVLDISHAQVERLTSLIDDLLDISRIQAGKFSLNFEEVDLGELLNDVISRFSSDAAASRCMVSVRVPGRVLGHWDRTRMEQIVVNLFSNAIKYAPGSRIVISAEQQAGHLRLSVKDSGPGIPLEKQGRIFDRYERVTTDKHTAGLGLGLFIVREIVQAHHGRIWLESSAGNGSNFIVEMPLDAEVPAPAAPHPPLTAVPAG